MTDSKQELMDAEKVALKEINEKITQAEDDGDSGDLGSNLAPQLAFMRANGKTFDDAWNFLQKVKDNSKEATKKTRHCNIKDDEIQVYGNKAFVRCIITTEDEQGNKSNYENLRLFVKIDGAWKLLGWANEPIPAEPAGPMINVESIDHVSLPVSLGPAGRENEPLETSKAFYTNIMGLKEIDRPEKLAEAMDGAWFRVGNSKLKLHLIVEKKKADIKSKTDESTFRTDKGLSSQDIHFALGVSNFLDTLRFLIGQQYWPQEHRPKVNSESDEAKKELDLKEMRVHPKGKAGFPQIFIMDPDRNVIELNVVNSLTEEEVAEVENLIQPPKN